MTLLLRASEVEDLIGPEDAIEITAEVVREEAAGTTIHIPQFGGASTARGRIVRIVGGGLTQLGRLGVRMGGGGRSASSTTRRTGRWLRSWVTHSRISASALAWR